MKDDLAKITLEANGALIDHLGETAEISMGPPYTVERVRGVAAERWPAAVGLISQSACARGDTLLADDDKITDGETIVLVPPVSGG